MKSSISRRNLLKGAVALSAAGMATAATAKSGHEHHHHHGSNEFTALIDTALDCIKTGQACLDHCFILLKDGDTEMAECAESVDEMLTMTNTLMELASKNSSHTKAFAAICEKACKDCADQCEKHAKKHKECKACMDACKDCEKACADVA